MPTPNNPNPLARFLTNQPPNSTPPPPSTNPGIGTPSLTHFQNISRLNNLFKLPDANPGNGISGGAPSVPKPPPIPSNFPAALPATFGTGAAVGAGIATALGVVAAGIVAYDLTQLWKLYNLSKPEPKFELTPNTFEPPFEGGQCEALYDIGYRIKTFSGEYNPETGLYDKNPTQRSDAPNQNVRAWGAIGGIRARDISQPYSGFVLEVFCRGFGSEPQEAKWWSLGGASNLFRAEISEVSISQADGMPDTCGNVTPEQLNSTGQNYPTIPIEQNAPYIPSLAPGTGSAYPTIPTGQNAPYIPSLSLGGAYQITPTVPDTPPGPNKNKQKDDNLIPPQIIKFPDGTTVQYKADGSITFNSPSGTTSTIPAPTTTPTTSPSKAPSTPPGKAPSKTPPATDPDNNNPFILPNVPLFPAAAPGTPPQQNPLQPASANCQPGTCSGAISSQVNANGVQAQQNNAATNYWGAMNYALNSQQVNQLNALQASNNTILTRLGPQIPNGGISGAVSAISTGLTNFTKWSVVDRLINLVVLISVLHNAYMLSAGLKVTLLEMISSLGNSTGLLQDSEGGNVDLNEAFNTGVESFMKLLLGEPSVDGMKKTWKKYNRVYQAAASMINSVQSMVNALANVIEVGVEYTGKVGNALKAAGTVAEKAYNWLPEQVSARTGKLAAVQKFGETVGDVTELFDNVSEASESVVEIQEQATELVKQNTEFKNALKDADLSPGIENAKVKEKKDKEKLEASKITPQPDSEGLKKDGDG